MAERFFCPGGWPSGRAVLEGDEARHLARASRVEVGEAVGLFDGLGHDVRAEVVAMGRDRVELAVTGPSTPGRDLDFPLVLASAVPKGERFDWLVEKATEIGVSLLVPIVSERSVVDPRAAKLDRLRRRVVEACKQSGRATLMALDEPTRWADWLESGSAEGIPRLIAEPGGDPIGTGINPARGVVMAIGPEGGFSPGEVDAARRVGYRPVALGPTILRIETAALAACAAVVALSRTDAE